MYVKPHLLNRHGVKWPPGFFTGQAGCSCCEPPPPPPPPPANPPYYYRGVACKCVWCGDNPAPCRWLLEVDSYANGSGACPSGTNCANNNGSFVLEKVGGFEASCKWRGPNFVTTTFIPSSSGCATCNNSGVAYWQFEVTTDGLALYWTARLYDATSNIIQAEYRKPILFTGYECSTPMYLPGATAYYTNGEFVCCFENPPFVLALPLF
jgi:hypothetical protein